jgi:hypothetical protein
VRILTPNDIGLRLGRNRPELPPGTRIVLPDHSAEAVAAKCIELGGQVRTSTTRHHLRPFSAVAVTCEAVLIQASRIMRFTG